MMLAASAGMKHDSVSNGSDFFRSELLQKVTEKASACAGDSALFHIKIDNGFDLSDTSAGKPDNMIAELCAYINTRAGFRVAVFRHALDQFYIYAEPPTSDQDGLYDAAEAFRALARLYTAEGVMTSGDTISLVIGATTLRKNSSIAEGFYRAHVALSTAREKSLLFFSVSESGVNREEIMRGQVSAGYVYKALEENRLRFAYQPVVDCKHNNVAYYECLLRLVEKDFSVVPAGSFIPIAEKMGFIDQIDRYVFNLALDELRNYDDVSFSVNISTITIQRGGYHDFLNELIDNPSLAQRLMVEVTESGMREDMDSIRRFMHAFRDAGCQVALDDFGVGHTSFAQLVTLPLDVVKVDGKFIRGLKTAPENWLLVDTVIKYGKQCNKKTVAEFVENEALAKELIAMDVDYLQGNYFSPAVNTRLWLEN